MPKLDPTERLKRLANRLKRHEVQDGRMTRAEHSARNGNLDAGGWYYAPGQTWLVRRWQAASLLGLYPVGTRERGDYAPTYWIEGGTAFVKCSARDWEVILIWQAGDDFYTRLLTGEEADEVSALHRKMTMIAFGFDLTQRPSDGPRPKRKRS